MLSLKIILLYRDIYELHMGYARVRRFGFRRAYSAPYGHLSHVKKYASARFYLPMPLFPAARALTRMCMQRDNAITPDDYSIDEIDKMAIRRAFVSFALMSGLPRSTQHISNGRYDTPRR